jgi:hypothetical protein
MEEAPEVTRVELPLLPAASLPVELLPVELLREAWLPSCCWTGVMHFA